MEDQNARKLVYFLAGAGLGTAVALLFAPKAGGELRDDIAETTRRGVDKASEAYQSTRDQVRKVAATGRNKASEVLKHAAETVMDEQGKLSAAVEAGKQAYRAGE